STAMTYVSQTAGNILGGIKHHPGTTVFVGLAGVLVLWLGLNVSWFSNPTPKPESLTPALHQISMTPLTNAGQSVCAAISPDGRMFAHVEKKDGQQQLLMTNIATAGTSVVIAPSDLEYRGI